MTTAKKRTVKKLDQDRKGDQKAQVLLKMPKVQHMYKPQLSYIPPFQV